MSTKPYVSVVIVGRNDDYGDDFLTRIRTFVRSLDHQARNHAGTFELVVVEWNPLSDRAGLATVLPPVAHVPTRVITVPAAVHDSLGAASPVLEYHGKNVGIRRARGEFVLVANPDILFSRDLIDEIGKKRLRSDTIYRTDRCDFHAAGIADVDAEHLVEHAVDNTFVVHAMQDNASVSIPVADGNRTLQSLPASRIGTNVWHTNGSGDFMLAAREAFYTVRGLYETLEHRWHLDSISLFRFAAAKMRQHVFVSPQCIFHQHHDRREQDVTFQQLDIYGLASRSGSTDWGFKNLELQETVLDPE
jgi:hypothetical protein